MAAMFCKASIVMEFTDGSTKVLAGHGPYKEEDALEEMEILREAAAFERARDSSGDVGLKLAVVILHDFHAEETS